MAKGFFAFYVELGAGYDEIKRTFEENQKCGLIEIPYTYIRNPWFVIQKRSPLKEIIKVKWVLNKKHFSFQKLKKNYDLCYKTLFFLHKLAYSKFVSMDCKAGKHWKFMILGQNVIQAAARLEVFELTSVMRFWWSFCTDP